MDFFILCYAVENFESISNCKNFNWKIFVDFVTKNEVPIMFYLITSFYDPYINSHSSSGYKKFQIFIFYISNHFYPVLIHWSGLKMRLVLGLAGLLGQAVADQCYTCTERFDSNGVLQTDNRLVTKKSYGLILRF